MTSTSSIDSRTQKKLLGIGAALCTLAIPYLILLQAGAGHLESAQSFCPFKMLTGFPCPGCGITKSIVFLYDGNLAKSLSYHLFGPALVAFSLGLLVLLPMEIISGKNYLNSVLYSRKLALALAVTLVVYHVIRLGIFVANHDINAILKESIWA